MKRAEAIILSKHPLREADEILVCLTREHGKKEFRAVGVKKPAAKHAGALQRLNHLHLFYVEGARLPIVTDSHLISSFSNMRRRKEALQAAMATLSSLERTLPLGFSDEPAWRQLIELLTSLDTEVLGGVLLPLSPFIFMYSLLCHHGMRPELDACVRCGRPVVNDDSISFSFSRGGIMHQSCLGDETYTAQLSPATVGVLKSWSSQSPARILGQELSQPVREEVSLFIDHFVVWQFDTPADPGRRV